MAVRQILKKGWQDLNKGWQTSVDLMGTTDRGHTVLPITKSAREFYADLGKEGIGVQTPVQLAGALGARLLTDVGEDASRHLYWRYNHPMAIADKISEQVIGSRLQEYSPTQRAAINLAAIGIPVSASLGTYDITNLGELGRPKGFAQSYAELGSEDRRETAQPAPEFLERFVLGRQGKPLKFETAQQEIPDLTKERYSKYLGYLYQDKGPLGLGLVKGTMENLQGEPEARIVGFPIGLQAVGALAGGATAVGTALSSSKNLPRARTVAGIGAGGALAGAALGKLANQIIASSGNKRLPTTEEYGIS
jgi:hypothetical protein